MTLCDIDYVSDKAHENLNVTSGRGPRDGTSRPRDKDRIVQNKFKALESRGLWAISYGIMEFRAYHLAI